MDNKNYQQKSFNSEDSFSVSNFEVSFLERKVPIILALLILSILVLTGVTVFAIYLAVIYYGKFDRVEAADIETFCGTIRGVKSNGINQYLGIPYAMPPIDSLRFRKPVDIGSKKLCSKAWKTPGNLLLASNFRNVCIQLLPITDEVIGAEDCLYINVFAPPKAHKSNLKPVVVVIGGIFFVSDGVNKFANYGLQPESKTVLDVDAVHVTFNYRIGPLGFLVHPSIGIPNIGVLDQVAALRWVRSNIREFGGDPVKVTIFSYGSGATTALALLGAPSAQHLFDKAWLSSPAINPPSVTLQSALESSRDFFNWSENSSTNTLDSLSGEQIALLWNWDVVEPWIRENMFGLPSKLSKACLPGLPCTGGVLVHDSSIITEDSFGSPIYTIPLIIGQNSNEAGTYITPDSVRYWTSKTMLSYFKNIFGNSTPSFQAIMQTYNNVLSQKESESTVNTLEVSYIEETFSRIVTDIRVTCPLKKLIEILGQRLSVFRYYIENRHIYFDPFGLEYFVSSAFHAWDAFLYLRSHHYHADYVYASLSYKNSAYLDRVRKFSDMLNAVMKQFIHEGDISGWKCYKEHDCINYYNDTRLSKVPVENFSFCSVWNELRRDNIFEYAWKA